MVRVRTCIFCGGGPLTDEHILGTQIYKLLPEAEQSRIAEWTVEPGGTISMRRARPGSPDGPYVANAVCRKDGRGCNDGWMAAMDTAVKPVIAALHAGERRPLTASDAIRLANWATKFTFTLEAMPHVKTMVFEQSLREEFGQEQVPPHGWRVWMMGYRGELGPTYSQEVVRARTSPGGEQTPVGRFTTIVFGRLVLQVLGLVRPAAWAIHLDRETDDATIVSVWPPQLGAVLPQAGAVDDPGLARLVEFVPRRVPVLERPP